MTGRKRVSEKQLAPAAPASERPLPSVELGGYAAAIGGPDSADDT